MDEKPNPYESPKSLGQSRPDSNRSLWPLIAVVGLVGIRSRVTAWAYFVACVLVTVAGLVLGADNRGLLGLAWFFGPVALLYFVAIRWVEKNNGWRR
jgi:K+ transporter